MNKVQLFLNDLEHKTMNNHAWTSEEVNKFLFIIYNSLFLEHQDNEILRSKILCILSLINENKQIKIIDQKNINLNFKELGTIFFTRKNNEYINNRDMYFQIGD